MEVDLQGGTVREEVVGRLPVEGIKKIGDVGLTLILVHMATVCWDTPFHVDISNAFHYYNVAQHWLHFSGS